MKKNSSKLLKFFVWCSRMFYKRKDDKYNEIRDNYIDINYYWQYIKLFFRKKNKEEKKKCSNSNGIIFKR